MFQSINPYNQELLAEYPLQATIEVENALIAATKAFRHWKDQTFEQRAALLRRVSALLLAQKEQLATLITQEMGKPISQSIGEIEKSAWVCDYYAEHGASLLQSEATPIESAAKSVIHYHPLGAVLLIMPWNFPFWQVFRCAAPILMAGNVVLLKHAPNVCGCSLAIARIFREAGAEEGMLQSLVMDVALVPKLIQHPVIRGVSLTGSVRAGSAVAALAGQHLKKTVLELGGSDACIVLADADVEQAAKVAVASRMINTGQTCIAAKRFIVQAPVAEVFMEAVRREFAALVMGDPLDKATTIGVMARLDLAETLQQQVQHSIEKGAKVAISGGHQTGTNAFAPMLLTDIPPHSPAYSEELFGPVASLWVVDDELEATLIANDTPFGLGASIWSKDAERAQRLARELHAGVVAINQLVRSDPRLPFGGMKQSGIGRELGAMGIKEFVNVQSVFAD